LVRGSAWVVRDGIGPTRMEEGDVAIFNGPEP
jgi:hypothetical protein